LLFAFKFSELGFWFGECRIQNRIFRYIGVRNIS